MGAKKPIDVRAVRARHEQVIADLVRQRDALRSEISALERRRNELGEQIAIRVLDLVSLLDALEQIDQDAEWIRRKTAIRDRLREAGRKAGVSAAAGPKEARRLQPELAAQIHDLVARIQRDNLYAHIAGDFSDKTFLQNLLLATYSDLLEIRWDGPQLILIEFQGRSAGHLPVSQLTPEARSAIASRLGLAP